MKPSNVAIALDAGMRAGRPIMTHGRAGVGKTELWRQLAQRRGIEFRHYRVLTKDPTDVQGVPFVRDGRTAWAVPENLPTSGEGVFLIDEINAAAPAMQASLYGIVLEGETEGWKKPPGWYVGCAGNLEDDRAIVQKMPTPLKTRLVHISVETDLEDWCRWALSPDKSNGDGKSRDNIRTELVAFLRFKPELLHSFDPDARTFPCPRTWEMASDLLDAGMPAEVEKDLLTGTVGEGPMIELMGFLRVFRQLPSIDGIILDPKGQPVPSDPSTLYAVAGALARKATGNNFAAVITYAGRMPKEFAVLLVTLAVRRDRQLQNTRAFVEWCSANHEVVS